MLRIIEEPDNLETLCTFKFNSEEEFYGLHLFLEYFENEYISIKFFLINGLVTVFKTDFSSLYSQEKLELFFNLYVDLNDLKKWLKKEVTLKTLVTYDEKDSRIKEVWKMNYPLIGTSKEFQTEDEILTKYHEFLLQNSIFIRCNPYLWNRYVTFYSPDLKTMKEKNYWFTLCLLKYRNQY